MSAWEPAEMQAMLGEVFAPWVQALDLCAEAVDAAGADFTFPAGEALIRGGGPGGGVLSGQAVAAAGDTASVVTLAALGGRMRACTTVDLTAHFMRPLPAGKIALRVAVLSNGRRMAVTRAEFRAEGSEKLAATVTCTFAWLEE
ncbi:MAG: PaaI family thioesterase [Pseudomonadota bacterium]